MNFSSSELPALIGGVLDFVAFDPPLVAKYAPVKVVARVAMASYEEGGLVSIGSQAGRRMRWWCFEGVVKGASIHSGSRFGGRQ